MAQAAPGGAPAGPSPSPLVLTVLAVLGVVALACAVALPLAPVRHATPVVSWPQDPAAPVSTSLLLAFHTPAALHVTANCAAARAAEATDDGVLFATQEPVVARARGRSLLWEVREGRAVLTVAGQEISDVALPPGDCELEVDLRDHRVTTTLDGTTVPASADPGRLYPRLDALATSLTAATAGSGQQLAVRVAVDDRFAGSPTPLKLVLVAVLLASGALLLAALARLDRASTRARAPTGAGSAGPRWLTALRPVTAHAAVVAGLAVWAVLAPMTDDDGYYAAMARNVPASGYVGQYYQLYDQSFVPLTWPWYALSWWQQVGDGPLLLRVPALVLCVATWLGLRRALDLLLGDVPGWSRAGGASHRAVWLLVLAYAAAAAPYVMGVRPEGAVAALAAGTLVGVLTTLRSGRLLPLAVAVVLAALGCAAHPTGAVALAPLVALLPRYWPLVSGGAGRVVSAVRTLAVIAPGAVVSAAGFADGTLFDLVEGRRVFGRFQATDGWGDEYLRYGWLLDPEIAMGAYAKRTTVLVGLVAVLCTLLLTAAASRRGRDPDAGPDAGPLPAGLAAMGAAGLLAYLALWMTPSKWTHHFGSLSGLLPLLVVLLVLLGPTAAARLWPRPALAPRVGLVAAVVAVAALSFTGANTWPYSWMAGLPGTGEVRLGPVPLGSLAPWGLLAVVAVLVVRWVRRSADPLVVGAAVTAVAALTVTVLFLGTTFAWAAYRTQDTYTPGVGPLRGLVGEQCDLASVVQVADPAGSRLLPEVDAGPQGAPVAEGFTAGGGWWDGDPLPTSAGSGAFAQVWGSLTGVGDDSTGHLTTAWYDLSALGPQEYLTTTVGGRPSTGNEVRVEWGASGDGAVSVVASRSLDDGLDSPEWRSARLLRPGQRPPAGADAVRLVAVDAAGGTGGWVAVSAPLAQPAVVLQDWLDDDAVVLSAWQLAYPFGCRRQPGIAHGVIERPGYALLWGTGALEGTGDSIWQYGRGGIAAPLPDAATLLQPTSELAPAPLRDAAGQWGQLVQLTYPYPAAAYDVTLVRETAPGWRGPSVPPLR